MKAKHHGLFALLLTVAIMAPAHAGYGQTDVKPPPPKDLPPPPPAPEAKVIKPSPKASTTPAVKVPPVKTPVNGATCEPRCP
ncbi:hypothetical protein MCEORH2_01178 [Methylophilaceae bacterium]